MDKFKKLVDVVLSFTDYVMSWVGRTFKGVIAKITGGLDPSFNQSIDAAVNRNGQPRNAKEFVANVDNLIKGTAVERFFKDNPKFIKELAERAIALKDEDEASILHPDLMPKTVQVTMHQQVIYCDDSRSMAREGRWDSQAKLVNRIARITTRILPKDDGCALRFINRTIDDNPKLSFEQIGETLQRATWGGDTPIGTNLKAKILQPLVYDKLTSKLERPLLVSIITDGMPEPEPRSTLVDTIVECGDQLEKAGLPRESVKFVIGQVGSANMATQFLKELADEPKIKDVAFVATERLDASVAQLEKDSDMDRWLIETLYSPFKSSEAKKDK